MGDMISGFAGLFQHGIEFTEKQQADIFNAGELRKAAKAQQANAVDAMRQGAQEAGRARMKATQTVAEQQMAYAYSGIESSVGTPAVSTASTRLWGELDAATLKNNAYRKALGYKEVSRRYLAQEEQIKRSAQNDELGLAMNWLGDWGQMVSGGFQLAGAL